MKTLLKLVTVWVCLVASVWSCGLRQREPQGVWYTNPVCKGLDNDRFYLYEGKYYILQNNGGSIYIQAVEDPSDAEFAK